MLPTSRVLSGNSPSILSKRFSRSCMRWNTVIRPAACPRLVRRLR
jgi:hypothetical protein